MDNVSDLFAAFGGPAIVGRAINVSTEHASVMKRRGSIPISYWDDLIREASFRKIPNINHKTLTALHTKYIRKRA